MAVNRSLWHPRHWPSWFGMGLGWLLARLPHRLQMWVGRRLGDLVYWLIPLRRNVAATNLRICFPEKTEVERRRLLRRHYQSVGMGAMETLICWWASDAQIERLSDVHGLRHLEAAAARGQGLILLSAHFTSLELGVRMAQIHLKRAGLVTTAMYKPPHDPVIEHVMRTRRETHIGEDSIPDNDVKGMIRALRNGRAVWYAADQRARGRLSALVPFFGEPANTHTATGRIAAMGNALIVPFFTLRRDDHSGYRLIVEPPLENVPSGDDLADAEYLNRLIEEQVRQAPEQYFWLHKRFKRRGVDPYAGSAK